MLVFERAIDYIWMAPPKILAVGPMADGTEEGVSGRSCEGLCINGTDSGTYIVSDVGSCAIVDTGYDDGRLAKCNRGEAPLFPYAGIYPGTVA